MPRSDWLFFTAIGGILAFGLAFTALQNERQNKCAGCYTAPKQQEESATDSSAMARSASAVLQAPPSNPRPTREEWREEQDLEAQRDMAYWAFWMMVFSGFGVGVTALGVVYVAKTLDANKEAVAAAKATADIAREAMIADKRAWIAIRRVRLVGPTSFKPDLIDIVIEVEVENIGATPAISAAVELDHVPERLGDKDGSFQAAVRQFTGMLRAMPPQIGNTFFPQCPQVVRHRWPIRKDQFEGGVYSLKNGPEVVSITILVGVRYRIVGDDKQHITFQPYSVLNFPSNCTLANGESIELRPMPFIRGEVD